MSADYWESTQYRHWLFTRDELSTIRKAVADEDLALVQQYPLPELRHLSIFFDQQLVKLGRRISIRQQVVATAQVYLRRFYLRNEIRRTNPYLVIATALYLACKIEECPQHIKVILTEARNLWPDFVLPDVARLGECEFFLIAEMNCQLVVHHPYRTLWKLHAEIKFSPEEGSLAWNTVNDHYLTDLPLLYPLHVIALTAIFVSMALKPLQSGAAASSLASNPLTPLTRALQSSRSDLPSAANKPTNQSSSPSTPSTAGPPNGMQGFIKWLAASEVDLQAMVECAQELISLYEVWEQYSDKTCKEQIARFVKARNLDK